MAKKKAIETTLKGTCFHYGKNGHYRRNCRAYLGSLKKKALDAPSTSGMFIIEVNTVSNYNQWVLDSSCGSHICADMQGLRNSRKLTKGEFDLKVGDDERVAVVAKWTYVLNLPSGFCLNLDNCCYFLTFTKKIVFVSYLIIKGFHFTSGNNCCSIMLNGVLYANGTLSNQIYIFDMSNPILNVNENKETFGRSIRTFG